MFWLQARAGGAPAPTQAAALQQPLLSNESAYCCPKADTLLWAPLPRAKPLPLQLAPRSGPAADHVPAAPPSTAAGAPQLFCIKQPHHQLTTPRDIQSPQNGDHGQSNAAAAVARHGNALQGGLQIGAHRPGAAASAPITIGGRRHDWWAVQLQEHRAGFVRRCDLHIGQVRTGHTCLQLTHGISREMPLVPCMALCTAAACSAKWMECHNSQSQTYLGKFYPTMKNLQVLQYQPAGGK